MKLYKIFQQATSQPNRYKPIHNFPVKIVDLILLRDSHAKPSQFQMTRLMDTISNDLEKNIAIMARKGF